MIYGKNAKTPAEFLQPAAKWNDYVDSPIEFLNLFNGAIIVYIRGKDARKTKSRRRPSRTQRGMGSSGTIQSGRRQTDIP